MLSSHLFTPAKKRVEVTYCHYMGDYVMTTPLPATNGECNKLLVLTGIVQQKHISPKIWNYSLRQPCLLLTCLLPWWIPLPISTMLVQQSLVWCQVWGAAKSVRLQYMEIRICSLFPAGSGRALSSVVQHIHTHTLYTHTWRREYTSGRLRLISSWNKTEYSLHSKPPLLPLCMRVCALAKLPVPLSLSFYSRGEFGLAWTIMFRV